MINYVSQNYQSDPRSSEKLGTVQYSTLTHSMIPAHNLRKEIYAKNLIPYWLSNSIIFTYTNTNINTNTNTSKLTKIETD